MTARVFDNDRDAKIWKDGYDQGRQDAREDFDRILAQAKKELGVDDD